ncbi:hypothetical protein HF086_009642 [Spodoptera exigua]|uniref:Uncharacterized protein n=1 Tax=Spodoptera exigua TaxID=7107 RepID=A0A922MT87_SPOEX|nr:hypothetical protein HF086_009642 [Spodoptera exigua]
MADELNLDVEPDEVRAELCRYIKKRRRGQSLPPKASRILNQDLKSPKKRKFQDEEFIAMKNKLDQSRSTYKICSKDFRIFKDYRTSNRQKIQIQTTYDLLQNQIKKYKEFAEKNKLNVDENILYLGKAITATQNRHKQKPVEEEKVEQSKNTKDKSEIIIKGREGNYNTITFKHMLKDFEVVRSKQIKSIQKIKQELNIINQNEEELRELKSKLREKAEYIDKTKKEIAEANDKNKELDAEITELEINKSQAENEICEKQNEIIEAQKKIQSMREHVEEIRQSYKKQNKNYNDEMQTIQEEIVAINADINAKELKLETERNKRDNIIKEICDKEKSINELRKLVEHLQNSNKIKGNELCDKMRFKNELLAFGFQTAKKLEKLNKEIAETENRNLIMKQEMIEKANKYVRMNQVLNNIKKFAEARFRQSQNSRQPNNSLVPLSSATITQQLQPTPRTSGIRDAVTRGQAPILFLPTYHS